MAKHLRYFLAAGILSIVAMPAYAGPMDATVTSTFCPSSNACSYGYTLSSDPSLSASAGTYYKPPQIQTFAGSGFVTLNYYYGVMGAAGNYVPVTITGSVDVSASGVSGEAEASINYANGGVDAENYGPGVLAEYAYSYVPGTGGITALDATYDVLSDTYLEITLFVDVNAATGGQTYGTSGASGSADPIITIDEAGYTLLLSPNLATTPLPSTWLMLLSGFAGLGFFAYRGMKKSASAIAAA